MDGCTDFCYPQFQQMNSPNFVNPRPVYCSERIDFDNQNFVYNLGSDKGEWTKIKDASLVCFCCHEKVLNNHICNGLDKENCSCLPKIRVKNGYIFPICKGCSALTTNLAEKLFGENQIHQGRLYGLPFGREISQFILYTLADNDSKKKFKKVVSQNDLIVQDNTENFEDKNINKLAHGFDVEKIEVGFCGHCGFTNETFGSYEDVHNEHTTHCPFCNNYTFVKTKCWVIKPEVVGNKIIIKRTISDTETLLCTDENESNAIIPVPDFKKKRKCFSNYQYPGHWNWSNNDNKAVKIATSLISRTYKNLEKFFGKNIKIIVEIVDTVEGTELISKELGLPKKLSFQAIEDLEKIENQNVPSSPVSVIEYDDENSETKNFFNLPFCVVCQRRDNRADEIKLPCGHFFHKECMAAWFNKNNNEIFFSCPTCQLTFNKNIIHF